jgi:hypothetical protein
MKARIHRPAVLLLLCLLATTWVETAAAQDSLARARELYNNADYEEAMAVLNTGAAAELVSPEHRQYRALCLVALGQTVAAQREFATIVGQDPFFVLDARELAPRMVAMFNDTRRKLLPDAVKRAFTDAKAQFQRGDHPQAKKGFDDVRRLLTDPLIADDEALKSLRLVVDGFFDLLSTPRPAPETAPAPPPPAVATAAVAPRVAPATVDAPPKGVSRPSIVLKQPIPAWRPGDPTLAGRTLSGSVKVTIGADGRVTSAVIVRRIHPLYDHALLEAASGWVYLPAILDGKSVPSEKTVDVELSPR